MLETTLVKDTDLVVELLVVVLVDELLQRAVDLGLVLVLHQGRVVVALGIINKDRI